MAVGYLKQNSAMIVGLHYCQIFSHIILLIKLMLSFRGSHGIIENGIMLPCKFTLKPEKGVTQKQIPLKRIWLPGSQLHENLTKGSAPQLPRKKNERPMSPALRFPQKNRLVSE